uniref:Putative ovule protein n=1 Tax=Solanum chacoense TaxID=4108 RepID=A0A0V0GPG5_SOLCH
MNVTYLCNFDFLVLKQLHTLVLMLTFEQSGKSKKAGSAPPTTLLVDFLKSSRGRFSDVSLLEEDMNFNQRAASLSVSSAEILLVSGRFISLDSRKW